MALIKCKECGKEISSMAESCPNCGCPIEREVNTEKKNKIIKWAILGLGLLILMVLFKTLIVGSNPFEEYTSFIGKQQDTLPDGYKEINVIDNFYFLEKEIKSDNKDFPMVDSTLKYSYCKDGIEEYDAEPNELYFMSWNFNYDVVTSKDVEKIQNILKKAYGKYDKKVELDNTTDLFNHKSDDFLCERYLWNNKDGLNINLDIEKVGDEYSSISIDWRKPITD